MSARLQPCIVALIKYCIEHGHFERNSATDMTDIYLLENSHPWAECSHSIHMSNTFRKGLHQIDTFYSNRSTTTRAVHTILQLALITVTYTSIREEWKGTSVHLIGRNGDHKGGLGLELPCPGVQDQSSCVNAAINHPGYGSSSCADEDHSKLVSMILIVQVSLWKVSSKATI